MEGTDGQTILESKSHRSLILKKITLNVEPSIAKHFLFPVLIKFPETNVLTKKIDYE